MVKAKSKTKKKAKNVLQSVKENAIMPVDKKPVENLAKPKYTVQDLMTRVDEYIEKFEFDLALQFCLKAHAMEPENVHILETLGNISAESGSVEDAVQYFNEAISEGFDAVNFYEKAIQLLDTDASLSVTENATGSSDSSKRLSAVFCSLAELFLTDLCMEQDAEIRCSEYCQKAIEHDALNMDAHIAMTNCSLSANKLDTARASCKKAFDVWQEISNISGDTVPEVLSYESRLTLVKLLIEVEEYACVPTVIEQLVEEDEDDVLIWYYMGLAKSLHKDSDDSPKFYLEKALYCFTKTKCTDNDILEHIQELLGQIEASNGIDLDSKDLDDSNIDNGAVDIMDTS